MSRLLQNLNLLIMNKHGSGKKFSDPNSFLGMASGIIKTEPEEVQNEISDEIEDMFSDYR